VSFLAKCKTKKIPPIYIFQLNVLSFLVSICILIWWYTNWLVLIMFRYFSTFKFSQLDEGNLWKCLNAVQSRETFFTKLEVPSIAIENNDNDWHKKWRESWIKTDPNKQLCRREGESVWEQKHFDSTSRIFSFCLSRNNCKQFIEWELRVEGQLLFSVSASPVRCMLINA
jgi:hypothetical protein